MRKLAVSCAAAALILCAGALSADAQTSRGAATINAAAQTYTPIEKAACGPRRGRWCPPFHHRVCGPRGRCWCAPC